MSNLFYLKSAAKGTERRYPPNRPYQRQPQTRTKDPKEVSIDFNSDPQDVLNTILYHISQKDGITKTKRLAYLNAFVKFMQYQTTASTRLTFDIHRIFICLRVPLVQEAPVIRIAALRVIRHLLRHEEDVIAANSLGIDTLVARSIDVVLNNSGERIQAIRLCQKILSTPSGAKHFPVAITRALISIGFDGQLDRDKLHRSSLSVLCQLALLNPQQFISCGGVRVLLHNIFGCLSPMVLEGILGSLFHLLNSPLTRHIAGINLQGLVAPLTDLHFKHTGYHSNPDAEMDERELGYRSSKIAIGILLRSWSGLLNFCKNGLQALIDSLYIEQFEIRRTILDLLCEIIGLEFPTWTDEVKVAIAAVDPSHPRDNWKLQEGFIIEEANSLLPHLANFTPNITANHTGLLILCLVRSGLLEALVDVILTSDTFLSVRATVLLGELLCLSDHYLPIDCFDPTQSIPSLVQHAMGVSTFNIKTHTNSAFASSSLTPQMKQQRAMEAITVLSLLHDVKAKAPVPSSMFLQMQMSFAGFSKKNSHAFFDRLGELQLNRILRKEIDTNPTKLLKETMVLATKDPMSWHWEAICCLLRWSPPPLKRVEDSSWRLFLKRLVDFYKPSTNNFDRLELDKENSKLFAQVGCTLFQFLADSVQNFSGSVLLEEIVVDIAVHLDDLLRRKENPHLALWSPFKMESTLSQAYFLFIGKLSRSTNGIRVLKKADILQRLVDVIREVRHDDYMKLIISCLYYGDEYSRQILHVVLTSPMDRTRIYATKFLRILVRVKPHNFSKWGAESLIERLEDTNPVIALIALDILEEAVHDKLFLESLISLRPSFAKFGDRGILLQASFASLPSGYKYLQESKLLEKEVRHWRKTFNKRYVEVVEVLVRDSVSTLRRGDDGKYPERATKLTEQSKFKDIFVPPHLYGQLAQHKAGFDLLVEQGEINKLIDVVHKSKCETTEETRNLKAALWSLSHFGTSLDGLSVLDNHEMVEAIVQLGSSCPILSVRHTVFHCLCLIASTQAGAENLGRLGWITMPRSHHEMYPIWGSAIPRVSPSLRRLRDLDLDLDQDDGSTSKNETSWKSNQNQQELGTSPPESSNMDSIKPENPSWLSESPKYVETLETDDSKAEDVVDSAPVLSTPKHSFSRSIRKRLSSLTSNLSGSGNTPVDDSEYREYRLANISNWRIAKSRSECSAEHGRMGDQESLSLGASPPYFTSSPGTASEFVQTLSPIASTASIAVPADQQRERHSIDSASFREPSGSVLDEFLHQKVPSFYRSMIRKPIIRIPTSGGSDIFPAHSPQRRMSLRELKTGSLDRHIQLTPRDLFNESKLKRVNTSLTSLSTPSYRSRPDQQLTKTPCFMGFCLPKNLNMIFLVESNSVPSSVSTYLRLGEGDGESSQKSTNAPDLSPKTQLRTLRRSNNGENESEGRRAVYDEIMRLVSNMISCIGVKATEQGLLRLKQKYPSAFQDIGIYCDVCDIISEYNVRLPLRRFLQELFLDLAYDEIYIAAAAVAQEPKTGEKDSCSTSDSAVANTGDIENDTEKKLEEGDRISEEGDSDYIDLK